MKIWLPVLMSTFFFAQLTNAGVVAEFLVNGTENYEIDPKKPVLMEFLLKDKKTKAVLKDFKQAHGKLMHMMIVREDLALLSHIHPYFEPGSGRFQITLNLRQGDPDNFQTVNALEEPGKYRVMIEVDIKGIGLRMFHFPLTVRGQKEEKPLVADPVDASNQIVKFFNAEGIESSFGAPYEGRFRLHTTRGCGGNLVTVTLQLREYDPQFGYVKMGGIENWLQAGGHAAWFSQDLFRGMMLAMGHLHADRIRGEAPEQLLLTFFDRHRLNPGLQKIWFQFKNRGKVTTVPFVFPYELSYLAAGECL